MWNQDVALDNHGGQDALGSYVSECSMHPEQPERQR